VGKLEMKSIVIKKENFSAHLCVIDFIVIVIPTQHSAIISNPTSLEMAAVHTKFHTLAADPLLSLPSTLHGPSCTSSFGRREGRTVAPSAVRTHHRPASLATHDNST
jgi:hypothetical protein